MEQLFFEAYEAHADAIFRHCYFRLNDRELAKDLMQEAFVRTWEYLRNGNNPTNMRAFIYRVASNLVIDHYRKKKSYSLEALAFLPKLPEQYRSVVVMRYIENHAMNRVVFYSIALQNTTCYHKAYDRKEKSRS